MKRRIVPFLRCIVCDGDLKLIDETEGEAGEVKEGQLKCDGCEASYPIDNYIPRFVVSKNYSGNFGFQFKTHCRTQLDKFSGHNICHTRFFLETGFPYELQGEQILEVGCGAGRFSEVALGTGAELFSVDLSTAVDVCLENHGLHERHHLFQASVYDMPFKKSLFDRVFCIGVIQHTPDPKKTLMVMKEFLKEGGRLAFNVYPLTPLHYFIPKYYLRPLTKRLNQEKLYGFVCWLMPKILGFSIWLRKKRIPVLDRYLRLFIPDYSKLPLKEEELMDWGILCVFDMLSPAYDKPQTMKTIASWMDEGQFKDVFVHPGVVARGTR